MSENMQHERSGPQKLMEVFKLLLFEPPDPTPRCSWRYDYREDGHATECGNVYHLAAYSEIGTYYKFCPGCGREIDVGKDRNEIDIERRMP